MFNVIDEINACKENINIFDLKHVDESEIHVTPYFTEPFDEIIPNTDALGGVFLGDKNGISELKALTVRNINSVLTINSVNCAVRFPEISYYWINARDHEEESLLDKFAECHELIDKTRHSGKSIYIHCHRGISRSATIVISYIMMTYKWSRDKAIEYVREKRIGIRPNDGFMKQLYQYELLLRHSDELVV